MLEHAPENRAAKALVLYVAADLMQLPDAHGNGRLLSGVNHRTRQVVESVTTDVGISADEARGIGLPEPEVPPAVLLVRRLVGTRGNSRVHPISGEQVAVARRDR